MEANRNLSLKIAGLYFIDSTSCLNNFTSSGFLYGLVILKPPYSPTVEKLVGSG